MDIHVIGTVVVGNGLEYDEVDFDELPLNQTIVIDTLYLNGREYDIVLINDEMFAVDATDYGPSTEDLMEWQAASCGMDYWMDRA